MDNFNNDMTNLPLGLAFGMAMDEKALANYGKLTEYEKERLIARSRNVKSKAEMETLVRELEEPESFF